MNDVLLMDNIGTLEELDYTMARDEELGAFQRSVRVLAIDPIVAQCVPWEGESAWT
jgi:hypothetical protein